MIRTIWNIDKLKNDARKIKYQIETDQKLDELKTDDNKLRRKNVEKHYTAIGASAEKTNR